MEQRQRATYTPRREIATRIEIEIETATFTVATCEADDLDAAQLAAHAGLNAARRVFEVARSGAPR